MSDQNDPIKWTKFIDQLIAKTRSGDIQWEDESHKFSRPKPVSGLFVSKYSSGKNILIYEYEFKYYHDEDQYDWDTEISMEVIDNTGKLLWRIPKVPQRRNLLDLIQFKDTDVADLYKELTGEDFD